jgi:predicted nucleic acid-binding protein
MELFVDASAWIALADADDANHAIEKIYADAELEAQAEEWLQRYEDQLFSYADAVSFALMQRRGINEAFAFDKHFGVAGFTQIQSLSQI